MTAPSDKVLMENPNSPDRPVRVDADKYNAMREAILAVLPAAAPGLTVAEVKARRRPLLPEALFPGGSTAGVASIKISRQRAVRGTPRRPLRATGTPRRRSETCGS